MDLVAAAREVGYDVGIRGARGDGEAEAVSAAATGERVGEKAAVEDVGAGVAGNAVLDRVARAVDRCRASQHEVIDPTPERVGDARLRLVDAAVLLLDDDVADVVDDVRIVARGTAHRVRSGAAVDRVVARGADE